MLKNWTSLEISFLIKHLDRSTNEIYQMFGNEFSDHRTYDSIQKKIRRLRNSIGDIQNEVEDQITVEDEILNPIVNPTLKLPHVTVKDKQDSRQHARDWLQEVVDITKYRYQDKETQISRIVSSDKSSLVVVLSDTHYGKHTPYFNIEEAKKRALSIPYDIHSRSLPEIDEIVLVLAGDMIEGEDIYATQNNHIECPVFEQTQECSKSLWEMILVFRKLFQCPVRIETCPGNHGRMSKTAHEKTNWDNVVYHLLKLMSEFYGDKDIIINPNFNAMITFPIKDKRILAYHHGVKHASTPAMREKIAGWAKTKNFDILCFTKETKVFYSDGRTLNIEDVKKGMRLLGKDGPTFVEVVHPPREVNEKIYSLNVEGIPSQLITGTTGEHPFFAIKEMNCYLPSRSNRKCHSNKDKVSWPCNKCEDIPDHNPKWINASDLKAGDFIGIPVPSIPKNPISNPRLAKLLGFFLAESSFIKNNKIKKDNEIKHHQGIKQCLKEFFKKNTSLDSSFSIFKSVSLQTTNIETTDFFLTNAREYPHKIKLSSWVWDLDKESRMSLISGWVLADAHLQSSFLKDRSRNRIEATTVSPDLASQMYLMALSCGLEPTYKIEEKIRPGENYFGHTISFYGENCKKLFEFNNIEYKESSKTKKLGFFKENLYYRKLTSVESEEKNTIVYNIKTSTGEYIAGLLSSHNCHGHWHEWHVGNWMGKFVLGNGCMCGPDDLAETMGKEDDARQGWFLVTPGKPLWGFSFVEWPTKLL